MSTPSSGGSQPLVSPEAPWLGLRAFTESLRGYFFGRERELGDLFERVAQKPLTVLFGQSGLGKTSLLQAALVPKLRHAGFVPVSLRLEHRNGAPPLEGQVMEVLQAVIDPAALGRLSAGPAPLWRLLHDPACGLCVHGAPKIVLILDQFEEIFTLAEGTPELRAGAKVFLHSLAEVAENRVPPALRAMLEHDDVLADRIDYVARPLKIVISMREDFLHRLERWRSHLPSVMDNRFELRLLTGRQALEAVVEPGRLRCRNRFELPPIISAETGEAIVRFVAGVADDVSLAEVDAVPPILSLLCAELNAQRGESLIIRPEQMEGRADDILSAFYTRCFAPHPPVVRRFVEDSLLSPEGFRQITNEDTFLHAMEREGLLRADGARIVARLVDDRLLVAEDRGGFRRLELAHDALTGIARRSRDVRQARHLGEQRRQRRQRVIGVVLAMALLMSGISVPLAIRAERARAVAQSERQHATDALAELEKARGAVAEGERAAQAESRALVEKERALAARKAADELIWYMQSDLSDLLGKLGQLKLTSSINTRIRAYHDAHPAEEENSYALRAQCVALLQQGDLLLTKSQIAEAMKDYEESRALALRLTEEKPKDARWQIVLSSCYERVGNAHSAQGKPSEALKNYQACLAIRRSLADEEPENADWQCALSGSQSLVGDALNSLARPNEALENYSASLAIRLRLMNQAPENTDWQRDLSASYENVGDAQRQRGERTDAQKSYEESLKIRTQLTKSDPENAEWQRDLSLTYVRLGDVQRLQGQLGPASSSYHTALTVVERLTRQDPENLGWQRDLAVDYGRVGGVEQEQGRWKEANDAFERELQLARIRLGQTESEAGWVSIFSDAAISRWKLLRIAAPGAMKLERSTAVSDLRKALIALHQLQKEGRLVPPMDERLPRIKALLAAAAGN